MPVIDTSVYIAATHADEPHHQVAFAWLDRSIQNGIALSAPAIFLGEVAATLSRGKDDEERALKTIEELSQEQIITLYPITHFLAERGAVIAAKQRIRGADALYVALAEHLGDELITLDKQQRQRGADVVTTRSP